MAASRRNPDYFEKRSFEEMDKNFGEVKESIREMRVDLRENSRVTVGVSGKISKIESKVNQLWSAVFPDKAQSTSQLATWYKDPNILKIIGALLAILAAYLGVDASGVLK